MGAKGILLVFVMLRLIHLTFMLGDGVDVNFYMEASGTVPFFQP